MDAYETIADGDTRYMANQEEPNLKPPKVFLSHASEDKERFVLSFAAALRERGVDVWLDKWEILPGDSLVDKLFEEGLKEADAVLIVISPASISKPWVKEELNTAIVNRITKQTKVIPVVLDRCEVPESLKSLVWEPIQDINSYQSELSRIVAAIFNHREKPRLGPPPSYVTERVIPGLHQTDMLVLRTIYEDAVERNRPYWDPEQIRSHIPELDQEIFLDSLEILEQHGYITIKKLLGGLPRGIGVIQPTMNGTFVYARAYIPETEQNMRAVALAILNHDKKTETAIAEFTGLKQFLISQYLKLFESRGWIRTSSSLNDTFVFNVAPSMKRAIQ
jgi:hypothetical protein